jgi:hypothetical protein
MGFSAITGFGLFGIAPRLPTGSARRGPTWNVDREHARVRLVSQCVQAEWNTCSASIRRGEGCRLTLCEVFRPHEQGGGWAYISLSAGPPGRCSLSQGADPVRANARDFRRPKPKAARAARRMDTRMLGNPPIRLLRALRFSFPPRFTGNGARSLASQAQAGGLASRAPSSWSAVSTMPPSGGSEGGSRGGREKTRSTR